MAPGVGVVTCTDVLNNVKAIIKTGRVLTDSELTILKNNLNNANIKLDILNINITKLYVVNVYNNTINPSPPITVYHVIICVASDCY